MTCISTGKSYHHVLHQTNQLIPTQKIFDETLEPDREGQAEHLHSDPRVPGCQFSSNLFKDTLDRCYWDT